MKSKKLRALIITAIFAAMSIVLGKFLQIPIGDSIRISFENLPIMLASFMFGPIYGGACGLVADLLGCVLRGYSIIPLITVAAFLMGVIPGTLTRYVFRKDKTPYVIISGMISHVVCSMAIKTFALHTVYGMAYEVLIPSRTLIYTVTGIVESYLCVLLMKNRVIRKNMLGSFTRAEISNTDKRIKYAMNYSDAVSFIESVSWKGSVPGLDRITELCDLLGHPEEKVKYIHIAGTNGKGSVSAIISSVLSSAGYKTGTFTSPHLIDYTERFSVNGVEMSRDDFCRVAGTVREQAEKMKDSPTEFELLTAMAFVYFADKKCDVAVLECGMGGRLDSTNAVRDTELSVITNIALDHTKILGGDELDIAYEKAGIIKRAPLVTGDISANVKKYLKGRCKKAKVPIYSYTDSAVTDDDLTASGLEFTYSGRRMTLPLCGEYQRINLRTAIRAIEILRKRGYNITDDAIEKGISSVKWIGRFEMISKSPAVIFDGAHNPNGAEYTAKTFKTLFPDRKAILVTGVMADKNYGAIADSLASVSSIVYTVTPDNPRAMSSKLLAEVYRGKGVEAVPCETVDDGVRMALQQAVKDDVPVLCTGSLYMYSQIVSAVNSFKK